MKVDREKMEALHWLAETLHRGGAFAAEVKNPDTAFAILLAGDELGFDPMASVRSISLVKNKVSLNADAQIGLCKRSPACKFFRLIESTATLATYATHREGDDEPTILTYTIQDATTAKLTASSTWQAHPKSMLRARCGAALARAVYPDVVAGIYDPDEAEEIRRDEPRREETSEPKQLPAAANTNTVDPLVFYRARLAAAATTNELVAVVLALAPTVPQPSRDAAWAAAQSRAADLGEQDLGAAVTGAKAITREPGAWTTVAAALAEISAAATAEAVADVVTRHGTAVAALPVQLKQAVNVARRTRLNQLLPLAERFERGLRAAADIPALDRIADQMEQAAREQALTLDEAARLTALYNERNAAFEAPASEAA